MKKRLPAVLVLVLAACGRASAPAAAPPTVVTPLMLEPPPVYALIGFRERLELTSEQIVQLDSIATVAKQQNAGLLTELHQKSQPTRSQTALVVGEEAKPVLEQIRTNNQEAARAVGEVLNPAQKETACQLFDMELAEGGSAAEREERREREEQRDRRARRGQGGIQLDTALVMMQRRVWPWCSFAAPGSTTRDRR